MQISNNVSTSQFNKLINLLFFTALLLILLFQSLFQTLINSLFQVKTGVLTYSIVLFFGLLSLIKFNNKVHLYKVAILLTLIISLVSQITSIFKYNPVTVFYSFLFYSGWLIIIFVFIQIPISKKTAKFLIYSLLLLILVNELFAIYEFTFGRYVLQKYLNQEIGTGYNYGGFVNYRSVSLIMEFVYHGYFAMLGAIIFLNLLLHYEFNKFNFLGFIICSVGMFTSITMSSIIFWFFFTIYKFTTTKQFKLSKKLILLISSLLIFSIAFNSLAQTQQFEIAIRILKIIEFEDISIGFHFSEEEQMDLLDLKSNLFGYGQGTGVGLYVRGESGEWVANIEHEYKRIWWEQGTLGFVVYLLALGAIFIALRNRRRKLRFKPHDSTIRRAIIESVYFYFIFLVIVGVVHRSFSEQAGIVFAVLFGLMEKLSSDENE